MIISIMMMVKVSQARISSSWDSSKWNLFASSCSFFDEVLFQCFLSAYQFTFGKHLSTWIHWIWSCHFQGNPVLVRCSLTKFSHRVPSTHNLIAYSLMNKISNILSRFLVAHSSKLIIINAVTELIVARIFALSNSGFRLHYSSG